jgi:hypothetical protein
MVCKNKRCLPKYGIESEGIEYRYESMEYFVGFTKTGKWKSLGLNQAKRLNTRIFALLNTDLPKPSSATPQGNVSEKRLEKSFFKNWANN